jgi:hypothetical protein
MLFDEHHTLIAKQNDEQASDPDWQFYYDRIQNKWISYGWGEYYSKSARVISNISRGFFNKSSIDKYLKWKEPKDSLVGISGTLEAYNTAKHFNNIQAMNYLSTIIPEKYKYDKKKYHNDWLLSRVDIEKNEI